jgi:hypothetical protein
VAAQACARLAEANEERALIEKGIGYAEGALAINPRLAEAKKLRDELRLRLK